MSKGVLIFAHNNGIVDYIKLATLSALYVRKHLKCPVSLVTDTETLSATTVSDIFDKIIISSPNLDNFRTLNGIDQPFINDTRLQAWSLTPYETTLVIDADYIVLSSKLSEYWDLEDSFMMAEGVVDFLNIGQPKISDKTFQLKWATTLMFKKDDIAKRVFEAASHVRENYLFYSDLYNFSTSNYRNDYAFTIAEHIVYGLSQDKLSLPKILFLDKPEDELLYVSDDTVWFKHNNTAIKIKPIENKTKIIE